MNVNVLSVINYLVDAYPRQEIPPETINVYVAELQDVRPQLLMSAARAWVRHSRFFPSVAELRETAKALYAEERHAQRIDASRQLAEENPVSEERRQENIRRARELVKEVARKCGSG